MPAFPLARGSGRLAGVLTHPARFPRRGGPPAVLRDSSTYLLTRDLVTRVRTGIRPGAFVRTGVYTSRPVAPRKGPWEENLIHTQRLRSLFGAFI
jgi:hypothetical protein